MATHPYEPVMHCSAKQSNKVINLGTKVTRGLTDNATLFPNPNPTVTSLTTELGTLVTLQGKVRGGGKDATAKRDAQSKKVHDMLEMEKLYVKITAGGDKDKILLSGFDVNEQPSPKEVPDKLSIRHTEPGPVEHSQKIFLAKFTSPLKITKEKLTFSLEISTDISLEANWDDAHLADGKTGETGNSKKLVVVNLVRKTEYWVRIAAINSKGRGPWSDPVSFVAQ